MPARPRLLIDAQLPLRERFAAFADVETFSDSVLSPEMVRRADALIVRSVTRVDRALLEDSSIRFVGTATSGTDHIDLDYLRASGIAFADAKGANAQSVAQYVLACVGHYCDKTQREPSALTLGIVGFGHVGALLGRLANKIGLRIIASDPLLEAVGEAGPWTPLRELLTQADIISLHVPFTTTGPHPTYHLIDEDNLDALKPGQALVQTSRGGVVDEGAVKRLAADNNDKRYFYFDVWENEPGIDRDLVALVDIATPHIAGYSVQSKQRAAARLLAALASTIATRPAGFPDSSGVVKEAEPRYWWQGPEAGGPALVCRAAERFPVEAYSQKLKHWVMGNDVASVFSELRVKAAGREE